MSSDASGAPVVASILPIPPEAATPEATQADENEVIAAVSKVTLSSSSLDVDEFAQTVEGMPLRFVLTHMAGCLVVWVSVGGGTPTLPHLALGMNSRFESGAISSMIGNFSGSADGAHQANGMSGRLAQRLKQPVFATCAGVPEHFMAFVEGIICKRLRDRDSAKVE